MNMSVSVQLIVVGVDMVSGQKYVVCTKDSDELPSQWMHRFVEVGSMNFIDMALLLFGACTDLDPGWADIRIIGSTYEHDDKWVTISYTCQIPLDTELRDEYAWNPTSNIKEIDPLMANLVLSAVRDT